MMKDPFDLTDVPKVEPTMFIGSTTVYWSQEWPFTDSNIQYLIQNIKDMKTTKTLTGTAIDGGYRFMLDDAAFADLAKGDLRWTKQAVRTSDSAVTPIGSGSMKFFDADQDRRTHSEIMVTKLQSLIEGRADHDVDSYSIGSRSITKMSIEELIKWRDYYRAEVQRGDTSDISNSTNKRSGVLKVGFDR